MPVHSVSRTLAVVTALSAACASGQARAAEVRLRLTVEVKVEGSERVIGKGDRTDGSFREGYRMVTYLRSDGDLMQFNPKDPEYAQKMMGLSASVQQRARRVQGKSEPRKMTQEQLQAYVQNKQAACGADQACLLRLATEAQQIAMSLMADNNASQGVAAYTGEEPLRFMSFAGYDNCGGQAHIYVDRILHGSVADVGGQVPYTIKDQADYDADVNEARLMCNLHQAILDTRDDTFYTDGALFPQGKGTSTMTMRGDATTTKGSAATHGEVLDWVVEQLRHAMRSGQRGTTLKLRLPQGAAIHSGAYSGEARVQMSWKFENVK